MWHGRTVSGKSEMLDRISFESQVTKNSVVKASRSSGAARNNRLCFPYLYAHVHVCNNGTKKQRVSLPSLPLRTSPGDTGRSFLSALISSRMRSCSVGGGWACGFSLRADTCDRASEQLIYLYRQSAVRDINNLLYSQQCCSSPPPHFPCGGWSHYTELGAACWNCTS